MEDYLKLGKKKDLEAYSSFLNWKEFEEHVERIFRSFDFLTRRNTRFRKPRAEIDLVALKNNLTFAVDCKHWKRTVGHSSMNAISNRQLLRAQRLVDRHRHVKVIPMIVTLHDESLHILENGVPIVPIHKVSDFILNWEEARDRILILSEPTQEALS